MTRHPVSNRREFLTNAVAAAGGAAAFGVLGPAPVAVASPARPEDFDAAVPAAWFDLALVLVRTTPGFTPPVASRAFGYAGVTLYEAVVRGSRQFRSLEGILPGLSAGPRRRNHLHWPPVANTALAAIMRSLFPTTGNANRAAIDAMEESLAAEFRAEGSRTRLRASVERGQGVAGAIFEWSRGDGGHEGYLRNFPPEYVPPVGSGRWVPTPPGPAGPAAVVGCQPLLRGSRRCGVPPGRSHRVLGGPRVAVLRRGGRGLRGGEQPHRRAGGQCPLLVRRPGNHGHPAGPFALDHHPGPAPRGRVVDGRAEAYAKVGMAVVDAFVACWNSKYRYHLLRPVTYIQRLVDSDWLPPLTTPPFPEYTSGHSVQSGAAFAVLADLFGATYSFDDRTHDELGLPPRHFDSFTAAAEEAAISRLYGGIHYRPAIQRGLEQGRCIGGVVNALPLQRR